MTQKAFARARQRTDSTRVVGSVRDSAAARGRKEIERGIVEYGAYILIKKNVKAKHRTSLSGPAVRARRSFVCAQGGALFFSLSHFYRHSRSRSINGLVKQPALRLSLSPSRPRDPRAAPVPRICV